MKKTLTILVTVFLLAVPTPAFAKGPFTYITVRGLGLTGELTVTNSALMDFFAFADFSKGSVDAPANPGDEYEITRVYVDTTTNRAQFFDRLHYYPDTGYVYYDGLLEGGSEYDGKWYRAQPGVEAAFRSVLAERARLTWVPFAALVVMLIIFGAAYFSKGPNR